MDFEYGIPRMQPVYERMQAMQRYMQAGIPIPPELIADSLGVSVETYRSWMVPDDPVVPESEYTLRVRADYSRKATVFLFSWHDESGGKMAYQCQISWMAVDPSRHGQSMGMAIAEMWARLREEAWIALDE